MALRVLLVVLLIVFVPSAQAQKKTSAGSKASPQKQTTAKASSTGQKAEATDRQRDLYKACLDSVGQVIQEAQELAKMADTTKFNAHDGRQQRDQLRKQVSAMQAAYGRLKSSLNADQRRRVQSQLMGIEQDRGRVSTQMQELNREMVRSNPERTRIAHHARVIRDSSASWQGHYRGMSSPLRLQ